MLDINLSSDAFSLLMPSSSLLPSSNINEDLHIILSNNGTLKIVPSLWILIFTDKRLRSLSLINLQLYENDALLLAQYLREQNYLIEFTLDFVRESVHAFDCILNDGLQNNTSIERLTLSGVEDIDAATVASLITHNKNVEYLSLMHNNISPDGAAIIADALRSNSKLISLNLSHNHISKTGAFAFANLFQKPHPSLTHIILIDNDIDKESQQIILSQCQHKIRITFSSETEHIPVRKHSFIHRASSEIERVLAPRQFYIDRKSPKKNSPFFPIALVTFLFFLWGIPCQLNDSLVQQFMKLFVLSRFEAGLVQSAFFMGYFVWALPAAYILRCWGYRLGIILGLVLFAIGSFLFWPAALTGLYTPFLLALFVTAAGLAVLETAANPFIANAAGPMQTSEIRLNIAQAFYPLGALIGARMGALFIFSDVDLSANELAQMRENKVYDDYLKQETLRVVQPYAILGGIALLWAMLIAVIPFSTHTKPTKITKNGKSDKANNLCRIVFLFAIIAQFSYVGAQIGTWSYFKQYIQDYVVVEEYIINYLLIGTLGLFAIGRLTAALLMYCGFSPSILLATCAFINVLLITITVLLPNSIGVATLFFTSFFMSLMFPTIFALGIKGMDESTTKLASCFLVMSCISGAIFPSLMNLISIKTEHLALAYILPGGAYIIIGIFALLSYGLETEKRTNHISDHLLI